MVLKPWREVVVPHRDVLEGTFQQSEFAADLTAVRNGEATTEYQDAVQFFDRTFITEGMRVLLTQVAERLAGKGGEPVIQLQTAFGGGKTHTLLAVYHLATRKVELSKLAGVAPLIDQAGLVDVPRARVAVLDGTAHAPAQPWKHGKTSIRTLWGELAWQLGGEEALARLLASDQSGTSPGKDILSDLLRVYSPCVILVDELVAFVRQFDEGKSYSGGTYDSNLSFVQVLTEAVKLAPQAIVLASLPESDVEAGSGRGVGALRALEKTFGRVQALWRPVATEEAFEIVRRRLFEPVRDSKARDSVCRAFADVYVTEGTKVPAETQEARYFDRLAQAYPIHPEVFDRLFEDWSTIDGFQRTRGVLKLMAKVIYKLWKDDNKDLLLLPGSLPLYDGNTRNELLYHLGPGWDPVIEKDIDGDRAETTELETKEPRFGAVNAARRVARTVFFGSAPSSVSTRSTGIRGIDRARVLLGCLQPGQTSSHYSDALNRLVDRLHYLNASGDKAQDATRYWFDVRANLRREMEDRKRRFDDKTDVRDRIGEVLKKLVATGGFFDGVHIFTSHADVPDDSALRLEILPPEVWYSKSEPRISTESVLDFVRNNGNKPRYRGNRVLFLAADQTALARLRDATRTALAWESIVKDVGEGKLNIDQLQRKQAEGEKQTADSVVPKAIRECYKWLLCPMQDSASDAIAVESHPLSTNAASVTGEIERVCGENELVIKAWSPVHLRSKLEEYYWTGGRTATSAMSFWEDTLRYLYLPRLRNRDVLAAAIKEGAAKRDYFGTAHGETEGRFEGFGLGDPSAQLTETLLLIAPGAAQTYEATLAAEAAQRAALAVGGATGSQPSQVPLPMTGSTSPISTSQPPTPKPARMKSFHGTAEVSAASAKLQLTQLADEIIAVLVSDPNAAVRVTLEIAADFPNGASDQIKRAVSENSRSLSLKAFDWE